MATDATLGLRGTADFSEPIGELARLQGAIDGLHGNRVKVTVDVDGVPAGITGLRGVESAAGGAAAAHTRLARESDRASRAARRLGDDSEHANRGMGRADESAQGLSRGLGGVGDQAGTAAARLRSMEAATQAVATAQQRALSATQQYENAYAKAFLEAPGKSVRERTMHAELSTADLRVASEEAQVAYKHSEQAARDTRANIKDTERESRQLGRTLRETGDTGAEAFLDLGGSSLRVGRVLGTVAGILPTVATGGAYAAAGMGLLTAGVAGLGVASAGLLGAAGVGMGAAAKGFTEFAVDSLKDMKGFKDSFENISKAVQGYSAFISEPYGAALVGLADKAAAVAPAIVSPLRGASREFADLLTKGTPTDATPGGDYLLEAAMRASQGALQITRAVMPGFQAGLRALPPLLEAAIPPATALASAVGVRMNQALREGVPAAAGLMEATAALGSKIAQIGAENFAPTLNAVTSLTRGVTDMGDRMRPAIGPSIQAVTDLGNAVTGGLGEAAPAAVTQFAQAVSRNAPGLRSLVSGITRDAGMVGETVADVLGALGPAVEQGMITGNGPHVAAGIGTFLEGMAPDWAVSASNAFDRAISNVLPNNQFGDFFRNQLGLRDWGGQGAAAGGGVASLGGVPIAAGHEAGGRELVPGRGITPGVWSGSQSQWAVVGGGTYRELPASQQARDVTGQPFPQGSGRISGGELVQINPHTGNPVADLAGMQRWQQYRTDLETAQPGLRTSEKNRAEQGIKYGSAGNAEGRYVWEGTGGKPPPGAVPPGVTPPDPGGMRPRSGGLAPGGPGQSVGPVAPQIAQLLNQEATAARQAGQAHQAYGNTVSAAQQQATNSTMSAAPQMQQQMSGAQAAVQNAQSVIPPAALQAFGSIAPAIAAAPIAPVMAPMMRAAVQTVSDFSGAAGDAGSSVGVSIAGGTAAGIQIEREKPVTIVEKLVKRLVQVAEGNLDAHSPSRVFSRLGASIPQGLAVGISGAQPEAVTATQRLIAQTVQGAQAQIRSNGAAARVGAELAGQLTDQPGGMPSAALAGNLSPYLPPGSGGNLPPEYREALEEQKRARWEERAQAGNWEKRLEGRGFSDETNKRIMDRWNRNADRDEKKDRERYEAQADAQYLALHGKKRPEDPAPPEQLSPQEKFGQAVGATLTQSVMDVVSTPGGFLGAAVKAIADGLAGGMANQQGNVQQGASDMATGVLTGIKEKLGISSPSRVAAGMGSDVGAGLGLGLAQGIESGSNAVTGIANNSGLMVGYVWARGFGDATDQVVKKSLLEAVSTPQIESPQAKAWLGAMGLLGPAGSGAQIYKSPAVTLGDGANTPVISLRNETVVKLNETELGRVLDERIDAAFGRALKHYLGA